MACAWVVIGVLSSAHNAVHAEPPWVADEIFLQMAELRKEIKQLQDKVSGLERQLGARPSQLVPIPLAGSDNMALGKRKASIAIVEFSDYECPYCAKHYREVLPKLRGRYIDKGLVRYVMMDFPLGFHAHAEKVSLSARCAGGQGQYWAMHDAIFGAHGQMTDALADTVVGQKKMDAATFKRCLEDPKQREAIRRDMVLGASIGINGTPAFLIGTVKGNRLTDYKLLSGVQPFEAFASIIDRLNH
jgi:protein-disulfide isomerase